MTSTPTSTSTPTPTSTPTSTSTPTPISYSGIIATAAGNGSAGYGGDNGPATSATIGHSGAVAVDSVGNLYFADSGNNRVRKVTPAGVITTIAGNGTAGYSGDGGQATSAALQSPQGVALDSNGNLYIADNANSVVRKVTPGGTITTVAGNGTQGYSGDNGPATSAQLIFPAGVAVDLSGNLFISDSSSSTSCIRKVTPGGTITTFAGTGAPGYSGDNGPGTSAQLASPTGISLDSNGNLYIADLANERVRKVTPGGTITTVAGNGTQGYSGDNGPATSAQLASPNDVAVDSSGNLYIADSANQRIRKVTPGGIISTVGGNGTPGYGGDNGFATSAAFNTPLGVAADPFGNVYVADSANNRIREITPEILTYAGYGSAGGPAPLHGPDGDAVDANGNLYIADFSDSYVRKVTPGGTITTVAGNGTQGYTGDNGPATSAELNEPAAVAVDVSGNLYIADYLNYCIRMVTPGGTITTVAGDGTPGYSGDNGPATGAELGGPLGVAVDATGNLYILDTGNNVVREVAPGGNITTIAGTGLAGYSGDNGPATSAALNGAEGIAVDSSGNLYIADTNNNRIRMVTPGGNHYHRRRERERRLQRGQWSRNERKAQYEYGN